MSLSQRVPPIPASERETVIVVTTHSVEAYTTNPVAWRALKRRAKALGGTVEVTHFPAGATGPAAKREIGGVVRLPAEAFSLARFGLRAKLPKAA